MADFAQRKGEAYTHADTYGQKIKKSGWASFLKNVLNVKLDFVPVLRNVKAIYETLTDPVMIKKRADLELHFLKGIGLGLWHTVEGVVELGKTIVTMTPPVQAYLWLTQPEKQLAQWEARAYMAQHPIETLKAMGQAIYDEVDKRVIHGSEESRAEFAGEAVFNIASMFVGVGEVSMLAKASQGEKLAAQAARVEAKAEAAATRTVEKAVGEGAGEGSRFAKKPLYADDFTGQLDENFVNLSTTKQINAAFDRIESTFGKEYADAVRKQLDSTSRAFNTSEMGEFRFDTKGNPIIDLNKKFGNANIMANTILHEVRHYRHFKKLYRFID
jgi:hypothetical protein